MDSGATKSVIGGKKESVPEPNMSGRFMRAIGATGIQNDAVNLKVCDDIRNTFKRYFIVSSCFPVRCIGLSQPYVCFGTHFVLPVMQE